MHERGEAAPVEQQNDLLASLERTRDRGIQRFAPRDRRGVLDTGRTAQINDLHRRQWMDAHAIG